MTRPSGTPLVALVVTGVLLLLGVMYFVVGADPRVVEATMIALGPFGAWFAVRHALGPVYLSPPAIVGLFWAAIGGLGFAFRDELVDAGGAGIVLEITDEVAFRALVLVSISASIIIVSGAVFLKIVGAVMAKPPKRPGQLSEWVSPSAKPLLVIVAALPLIAFVSQIGVADFVSRDYYIVGERGSFVAAVVLQLATLVVVLIGYLLASRRPGTLAAAVVLLVGYSLLLSSFGSRRFALIPILVALGYFLARNSARSRRGLIFGAVATLLLLPLPLEFRANATHGLAPYAQTLSQLQFSDIDWLAAANNILVGFPIIGASAYGNVPVYASDLLISLNPLPGTSTGWYDIYERLRLNFFTPTAAIGEIGQVGWTAVVLIFTGTGIALAWLELVIRRSIDRGNMIYVGLVIGLATLYALQMTQYNLRQASRVLVYAIVMELVRRVFTLIRGTSSVAERAVPERPGPRRAVSTVRRARPE